MEVCNIEGRCWSEVYFSRHKEIICPKPCRPASASQSYYFVSDDDASLGNAYHRSSCRETRNRASCSVDPIPDKFNLFLHKDKFEFEGLMDECCPPSRTDNPLVRDLRFISQSDHMNPPPHNCTEVSYKHDPARLQAFLRIEGFACGS